MDKPTKIHFFLSAAVMLISALALGFGWSGLVGAAVVVFINLYLLAILVEAVYRRTKKDEKKADAGKVREVSFFAFPSKIWVVILTVFIIISTVGGFANMYLDSAGIVYTGPRIEAATASSELKVTVPPPTIMNTRIEAVYFSMVTMITLGYGDFLPVSTTARLLVIWQLATGGLMVMAIFPLIVTRIANF